jgi:hypothetical protein
MIAALLILNMAVTRRSHHSDHDCGIGRPCRAGRQRRPSRRFAALARRCRAGYGLSCPGRQYLRSTGADRDRLRRCHNWQFQCRLRCRRCVGAGRGNGGSDAGARHTRRARTAVSCESTSRRLRFAAMPAIEPVETTDLAMIPITGRSDFGHISKAICLNLF